MSHACRTESDFLGVKEIPADSYWGIHTARATENFPISGIPLSIYPELIHALGAVKLAAVRTNREQGHIDDRRAGVIEDACADVMAGRLDEHFVVDVVQGGAGTSTNMNVNEVIANRALELLGVPRGHYDHLHPIDHVNRSQSTNDAYPTAVKIALLTSLGPLSDALEHLINMLASKSGEFADVLKIGRTQLQDAVPMTVGQEFAAWAATLGEERARVAEARRLLTEINLGATAIGTGITTAPGYAAAVCRHLCEITGLPLSTAANLIEATSDTGVFVYLSGVLKRLALKVSKICNDLRLLSSGPQSGFGELRLPPRQAGSSIMPGKVNPVIPEVVNQIAFAVVGNDVTISMAAEGGQLQLNAFEPIMVHRLLESMGWMRRGFTTLADLCIAGIEVNVDHLTMSTSRSAAVVTALLPYIGYGSAAQIAKKALAEGGTVRDLALATGSISSAVLDELLRPEGLANVAAAVADGHASSVPYVGFVSQSFSG